MQKGIGLSHPRQGSSGRESTSVSPRMSHLYLLESSKQMSFCSLVLHKYGTCCWISSYASQLLEYLFIKWHKTDNQHSLFQGGGGHAAEKKAKQWLLLSLQMLDMTSAKVCIGPLGNCSCCHLKQWNLGLCRVGFFFLIFLPFFPWNIIFIILLTLRFSSTWVYAEFLLVTAEGLLS